MLKILSTKTLSAPLLEKAKGYGIEITEHPFITINPVNGPQTKTEIRRWLTRTEPFFAVFTSANAVDNVTAFIKPEDARPRWSIFCISGRTRESLAPYIDPAKILETAEYGQELAKKILNHPVKELVFFCGNRRRDELPRLLREKGINVHEIVVYHTSETPVGIGAGAAAPLSGEIPDSQPLPADIAGNDIIDNGATGNDPNSAAGNDPDGILFFSPSAVSSFFSLNTPAERTVCFAIGHTTAESIAQHTSNKIITSRSTSQEMMIDTVQEYFQHNKGNNEQLKK